MAIENLPRPWVLAALTGLRVTEIAGLPADQEPARGVQPLLRPQHRRRRLRDVGRDCRPTVSEARPG